MEVILLKDLKSSSIHRQKKVDAEPMQILKRDPIGSFIICSVIGNKINRTHTSLRPLSPK